ncbi:MAG: PleD family two-component system response regulator [Beijerinckiaceae bacterium]
MTARVLVVDDLLPNIKLLEARLSAEYFDVLSAMNGPDALSVCLEGRCDIVLLDVMMPGMDGLEVCRRLKGNPATAHIPVVMVTALDQPADRVRGLDAGADDFLTKPVDEVALIARVRSLARLKVTLDELRSRCATAAGLGASARLSEAVNDPGQNGRVLLVDDRVNSSRWIEGALRGRHSLDVEADPAMAGDRAAAGDYELIIVSLNLTGHDGLRICGHLRSMEQTRQTPILMIAEMDDRERVLRGLDMGVNDYLARPIDRNELIARVRTQLRRKRYADALRTTLTDSINAALVDALTGLYNRRYLETHLAGMLDLAVSRASSLSLMVLDIDHFKSINDTWGHDAGDEVLRAFAQRVKRGVREADLVCRLGGEEFVVIMPEAEQRYAASIAERVRQLVEAEPFAIQGGAKEIRVTVSIGLAEARGDRSPDAFFRRADRALYRSKHEGRNRVTLDAA